MARRARLKTECPLRAWGFDPLPRHSSSNTLFDPEERADGGEIVDERARRQRREKRAPVGTRPQPRIEDRDDAAIFVTANQSAEALT